MSIGRLYLWALAAWLAGVIVLARLAAVIVGAFR